MTSENIQPTSIQPTEEQRASTVKLSDPAQDFATLLNRITRESNRVSEDVQEAHDSLEPKNLDGGATDVLQAINKAADAYRTLSQLGAELTRLYAKPAPDPAETSSRSTDTTA